MMKMKQSILATALAMGLGVSGQAAAYIYGGAGIDIQNTSILILEDDGTLATINSFDFRTSTAADLNGALAPNDIDQCSGTPASNNCGGTGAALVLDSNPSSIGIVRVNNSFTYLGPGGGEFGSADAVIWDAQLVGDTSTHVQAIAEAELVAGTSAGATATIRSTTGFTMNFTVGGTGLFSMTFDADPDVYAELIDPTATAGTASATLNSEVSITGPGGLRITWFLDGTSFCVDNNATVNCTVSDGDNLNAQATAPFGGSDSSSWDPLAQNLSPFSMLVTGLPQGIYSLTLSTSAESNVTRVPEPGSLALLGLGLASLGAVARRKKARA